MYVGIGLTRNRHGVWVVRRKVPKRLREPVAHVLDNGEGRQTWLQKTTCMNVERCLRETVVTRGSPASGAWAARVRQGRVVSLCERLAGLLQTDGPRGPG